MGSVYYSNTETYENYITLNNISIIANQVNSNPLLKFTAQDIVNINGLNVLYQYDTSTNCIVHTCRSPKRLLQSYGWVCVYYYA